MTVNKTTLYCPHYALRIDCEGKAIDTELLYKIGIPNIEPYDKYVVGRRHVNQIVIAGEDLHYCVHVDYYSGILPHIKSLATLKDGETCGIPDEYIEEVRRYLPKANGLAALKYLQRFKPVLWSRERHHIIIIYKCEYPISDIKLRD